MGSEGPHSVKVKVTLDDMHHPIIHGVELVTADGDFVVIRAIEDESLVEYSFLKSKITSLVKYYDKE